MSIYLHNEVYRQEIHRQADHERLVRLAKRPSRPSICRPLLVQLGRQMSHLGEQLQEHYRDETLLDLAIES